MYMKVNLLTFLWFLFLSWLQGWFDASLQQATNPVGILSIRGCEGRRHYKVPHRSPVNNNHSWERQVCPVYPPSSKASEVHSVLKTVLLLLRSLLGRYPSWFHCQLVRQQFHPLNFDIFLKFLGIFYAVKWFLCNKLIDCNTVFTVIHFSCLILFPDVITMAGVSDDVLGKFQLDKSENFDAFMAAVGVGWATRLERSKIYHVK